MAKEITEVTISKTRFKFLVFSALKVNTVFTINSDQDLGVRVDYIRLIAKVDLCNMQAFLSNVGVKLDSREELTLMTEELFKEIPGVIWEKDSTINNNTQFHYFKITIFFEGFFKVSPPATDTEQKSISHHGKTI